MASIKDVARRAGVSISTVSNVLNSTKRVSDELTKSVNCAISELNYEVDPVARNMKMKQSKTIGVITVDMCGLYFPYLVKGIYELANYKKYGVIISDINCGDAQLTSVGRELECFRRLIYNRVDGIIFASTVTRDILPEYIDEIERIAGRYKIIPLVSMGKDLTSFGLDSVYADNYEGGKKATRHLLECGCRKIGHVTGPARYGATLDRKQGYYDALAESGLDFDENLIVNSDYTQRGGFLMMNKLLSQAPDIDGVFVGNDQMAVGVLKAITKNGRRIPQDIKLIGFDDVFVSSVLEPPISSINVRKRFMGEQACRLLMDRLEGADSDKNPVGIEIETKLVVRKSTDISASEDWILSEW
ncbi:MAG: LacI family DNA-binding transcriptional regulator [Oscillospiraceae bacterium]